MFGTDVVTDWVNGSNMIKRGDVIWGGIMVALPFLPMTIARNTGAPAQGLEDGVVDVAPGVDIPDKEGDGIDFDAVLVGLGNEFKMHHLHAKRVKRNESFKELADIVVRESALP